MRLSGERAGERGFELKNHLKTLCLLTPALSSLGGGEGENGARVKLRPQRMAALVRG